MAYPLDCGDDVLDPHFCEDFCGDITEEHARIRKGAWIHKSVVAAILDNPSDPAVWAQHIASGKVIVLPMITGSFDGGSPRTVPGYGDFKERHSGFTFGITFRDPVYAKNYNHYKSINGKTSWHYAFVTESLIHITGVPVSATPKVILSDSTDDLVVWETAMTWDEKFAPAPHAAPDIFACDNAANAGADQTFDTVLTFTASNTDIDQQVRGTIGAAGTVSPTIKLEFNKDTTISGLPTTMLITVGGAEAMTVDFPSDYLGKPFRFTAANGSTHLGTFKDGTVAF